MPSQHCRATIVLKRKGQLWRIYGAISVTCFQAFACSTPISDLSLPEIERHLVCRPLHHYLPISQHLTRYYLHRWIQHRLIQPIHRHGRHHHSHCHGRHHHSHRQSVRHHHGLNPAKTWFCNSFSCSSVSTVVLQISRGEPTPTFGLRCRMDDRCAEWCGTTLLR